jgi:putative DNA primase/helicase
MSNLGTALSCALERGWRIFPCQWRGKGRKTPLTPRGCLDASNDPDHIIEWWTRWPDALIGLATGTPSGVVVLDVDVKHPPINGFETLDELGFAILPDGPMAHTESGGLHLYFDSGPHDIRNTQGATGRGIGRGLDWRGTGGYVIVPSPKSGYWWDPHQNFDTVPLAPVPNGLFPREPERRQAKPIEPTSGLSPYAEAALDRACRAILAAPAGEQEITLTRECFSLGTLAGSGGIPQELALMALHDSAQRILNYDPRRPWRAGELNGKVRRAFNDGLQRPRQGCHAA